MFLVQVQESDAMYIFLLMNEFRSKIKVDRIPRFKRIACRFTKNIGKNHQNIFFFKKIKKNKIMLKKDQKPVKITYSC